MDWSNRKQYDADRYAKRKQALIEKLGGKCANCGKTENLEFDHIDRQNKTFTITASMAKSSAELEAELEKCQLLCEDCHKMKTISEKSVEHGGGVSGKYNCKCDACREKKNAYMREYKASRKHTK